MCYMPGLCVEILQWPGIFKNIDKGSSGEETILENSTQISIMSFPGIATKGYCINRKCSVHGYCFIMPSHAWEIP